MMGWFSEIGAHWLVRLLGAEGKTGQETSVGPGQRPTASGRAPIKRPGHLRGRQKGGGIACE